MQAQRVERLAEKFDAEFAEELRAMEARSELRHRPTSRKATDLIILPCLRLFGQ
jgi:hypothetical protein